MDRGLGRIQVMNIDNYNNLGMAVIAIHSAISVLKEITLSKAMLIMPFYSHKLLTDYLARKGVEIKSIEHLIAMKTSYFSNFNDRYKDSNVQTIHAIQYLIDAQILNFIDGNLVCIEPFEYDKKMGNRAMKMDKASINMAKILSEDTSNLYLNLRVIL